MSTKAPRPDHWPGGYDRVILSSVDSTMAEAARRAPGITAPTWILARHQTAARGRRGRTWVQPAGAFAATLICKPADGPVAAAQRSFVAALALHDALSAFVEPHKLALKWPNDVLLEGGKVAGILLESSGTGGRIDWLSVGIGVNLTHVPEAVADAAFAPTSLMAAGGEVVTAEDFLTALAHAFATQEAKMQALGFARIRADWLKLAARLGEVITARTGAETISGVFDTIDDDGNLILITGQGPRTIAAADVHF